MPQTTFDRRVTQLEAKHRLLSAGVSYRIGPDGLITAYPQRRFSPRFPGRGLVLLFGMALAFKVALFMASGEVTYTARLAELAQGQAVERAMAWVMQPDTVTRSIALGLDMLVNQVTGFSLS